MVLAMNRIVMNGTPRTNSMKMTHANLTTGIFDRRPSASRTPKGNEKTIPKRAVSKDTKIPPQSSVSTMRKPSAGEPRRRRKARTG